jgi:isopenicillin-N epimerase
MSLPPDPFAAAGRTRSQWMLDPRITFLNHGSFGGVPRVVFEAQTEWRRRVEAEPIEMLARRGDALLDEAKQPVGQLLSMRPTDFGFVTNATEGVNAVIRSTRLSPGDELLTTTHVYNAVRKAMQFVARQRGATYREIDVPLPVDGAAQIAQRVIDGLGPRTRLLVLDHVTSPTALIFPVEQICAACAARGIEVLIDGAHGPGMLDLNVPATGATYYAGNLHKWCCCPKGSGFLWVHPDRQADVHPLIISHFLDESFVKEFGWQGTRDVSSWLTIPTALQFMASLGWREIRQHNHALATWAHAMLADQLGLPTLSPRDGRLLGSMASLPLPHPLRDMSEAQAAAMQQRLYDEFHLEMPLMLWAGKYYLRVCAQVYNTADQYGCVVDALRELTRSFR